MKRTIIFLRMAALFAVGAVISCCAREDVLLPPEVGVDTTAPILWDSSNCSSLNIMDRGSVTIEGITLSTASDCDVFWRGSGLCFSPNATGGYTFTNTLGKNFSKIVMTPTDEGGWSRVAIGEGWAYSSPDFGGDGTVIWTGNAASVSLLYSYADFSGAPITSIAFILLE